MCEIVAIYALWFIIIHYQEQETLEPLLKSQDNEHQRSEQSPSSVTPDPPKLDNDKGHHESREQEQGGLVPSNYQIDNTLSLIYHYSGLNPDCLLLELKIQ